MKGLISTIKKKLSPKTSPRNSDAEEENAPSTPSPTVPTPKARTNGNGKAFSLDLTQKSWSNPLPKDILRIVMGFLGVQDVLRAMEAHSSFYRTVEETVSVRRLHDFRWLDHLFTAEVAAKGGEFVRQFSVANGKEGFLEYACCQHVVVRDAHGYKSREDYAKGEIIASGFLPLNGKRVFVSFDDEGYFAMYPNGNVPAKLLTWRNGWGIPKEDWLQGLYWPSCVGTQMDSLSPKIFLSKMAELHGLALPECLIFLVVAYNWLHMKKKKWDISSPNTLCLSEWNKVMDGNARQGFLSQKALHLTNKTTNMDLLEGVQIPVVPWNSNLCHASFKSRIRTFRCCVRGWLPRPIQEIIIKMSFDESKDGFRASLMSKCRRWYPKLAYPYTQEASIESLVQQEIVVHFYAYEKLLGEECRAWYSLPQKPDVRLMLWNERTRRGSDMWSRDAVEPEALEKLQRLLFGEPLLMSRLALFRVLLAVIGRRPDHSAMAFHSRVFSDSLCRPHLLPINVLHYLLAMVFPAAEEVRLHLDEAQRLPMWLRFEYEDGPPTQAKIQGWKLREEQLRRTLRAALTCRAWLRYVKMTEHLHQLLSHFQCERERLLAYDDAKRENANQQVGCLI